MFFNPLTFNIVNSQPVFQNDSTFKPFHKSLFNEIDSAFKLDKEAQFELRFWTLSSKTMKRQLFILSLKNSNWTARLFSRTVYQKDTLIEISVIQTNLNKLWKKLKKKNLLTIPREEDLVDKNGNQINDPIHDGVSYLFELISTENKRWYWYHCPKSFSEDYKYIKEYKDVVGIIKIVYKHCRLTINLC